MAPGNRDRGQHPDHLPGVRRPQHPPRPGHPADQENRPRTLEKFNAELRRCRTRCDGKPFVVHQDTGPHDCVRAKCKPHVCKPLAASMVRQIHAVIGGALSAAVRWEWLASKPGQTRSATPTEAPTARSSARRGSRPPHRCGLRPGRRVGNPHLASHDHRNAPRRSGRPRWSDVDLDTGMLEVRQNYVRRAGISKIKDTKTHQMRRVALVSAKELETSRRPNLAVME